MSQSGSWSLSSTPGTEVLTLTGNTGGPISPTAGNINVVGSGNINVAGTPGSSTLTIEEVSPSAITFDDGDVGSTTPTGAGVITFSGQTIIDTLASANHVYIGLTDGLDGQIPIAATGNSTAYATITAGSGISIVNGANSITISSTASFLSYTSVDHAASPYTVLSTDNYISADVTGGVISILLPDTTTTGRTFIIKDKAGLAATSNITITTVGGIVTIDGSTSFIMNTAYEAVSLIWSGTTYEVY